MTAGHLNSSSSAYVVDGDRYVVMLAVSYHPDDVDDAYAAAEAALELTRDGGQSDTLWLVLDRETGTTALLEQGDFDGALAEGSS